MGLDFQVSRFLEKPKKEDVVFITDLSVNEKNQHGLNEFVNKGGKVQLIDHHKTALDFNDYSWANVQVEYDDGRLAAATSLFYEHLKEEGLITPTDVIEEFVELVRQYDTWEWDKNNNIQAKRLNDLFFLISIDDFEERMVERLKKNETFAFDEFEEKMLALEEGKIQRYVRKKKRELVQTFIEDYCVGIVHAESYHSELGNELGKDNPHLDYIAIVSVGGKRMSLRTIHDHIDVSEIAGEYGGGGHAKASGCSLTTEAYEYFVAEPFKIDPMKADAYRNQYNIKQSLHGCLYENRDEDQFFVFNTAANKWQVEWNGSLIEESFHTFQEAENYIKRNYSAWLVRDEVFVQFLMENAIEQKLLKFSDVREEELEPHLVSQYEDVSKEDQSYQH
ncbi:oligoribonuclease [Anaerobacillus alkalilacustris]|uniref:Oligoribonuclease n=1 Tax=Anaerobacillus alkalilacustris TaxID=393763 RepID=A0A1S2LLS1_9BACI|nr:oligoribonuclease [Anaerobacillus alkalilacustris]OIJ13411.1 oligoribonuclease [Anaerobacillus alkalilacustris]